jgi:subtilisin family serine protease
MDSLSRWGCQLIVAAVLLGCDESQIAPPNVGVVSSELTAAFDSAQSVDVIVMLRDPARGENSFYARDARRQAIAKLHDAVLARLDRGFVLSRRYQHTPAFAGRITQATLEQLARDPDVQAVQLDHPGSGLLKEAESSVGADKVVEHYKLTGRGVRVAVLDTGVDLTHPDLRDAVVAQHCFSRGDCPPLRRNEGTSAQDDHGHGTNVTGVIASRGVVSAPGFAPEVEIVAVKIMDQNNSGQEADWLAGLDWVYDNLAMLKVDIVNLSVGTNQLYTPQECDLREAALTFAINNLVAAGVTVIGGSGNKGSATALPAAACNTGVIAVGASYDSAAGAQPPSGTTYAVESGPAFANCSDSPTAPDQITCFTNSNERLDLIAPGAPIVTDALGGATKLSWGTSEACAAVSGIAALMKQCKADLAPADLKQALVDTGVPRVDPKNNRTFPVVRALAAVQRVCPELDAGVPLMNADAGPPALVPEAGAGAAGAKANTRDDGAALGLRYIAGSPASDNPGSGQVDAGSDTQPSAGAQADSGGSQSPGMSPEQPADSKPKRASGGSCNLARGSNHAPILYVGFGAVLLWSRHARRCRSARRHGQRAR